MLQDPLNGLVIALLELCASESVQNKLKGERTVCGVGAGEDCGVCEIGAFNAACLAVVLAGGAIQEGRLGAIAVHRGQPDWQARHKNLQSSCSRAQCHSQM